MIGFGQKTFNVINNSKSKGGLSFLGTNLGIWEYYYENGKLGMKIEFKEQKDYKYINGKRTIKQEIVNKVCWGKTGNKIE